MSKQEVPGSTKATDLAPFRIEKPTRATYLKMLVYGPFGVGKTRFAGTAKDVPEMRDVLFLDAEAGQMTLAEFAEDVDVIRITDFRQFARVFEWLREHVRARNMGDKKRLKELQEKVGLEGRLREYRTVVIDSITEVQKFAMYQLTGVKVTATPLDMEPDSPGFQIWGQAAEMMRLLIRTFRDLDMHVIFCSAEQEREDQAKRVRYMPALPGKLAFEAQGFLDVVGYYRALKDGDRLIRRLFLAPTEQFAAKDRYHAGNVVPWLDNPTMAAFLEVK